MEDIRTFAQALSEVSRLRNELTQARQSRDGWRRRRKELERAVGERYMELPLDADGVPVMVGDLVSTPAWRQVEVIGVSSADVFYRDQYGNVEWTIAAGTRHEPEPESLREVLAELAGRELPVDELEAFEARARGAVMAE